MMLQLPMMPHLIAAHAVTAKGNLAELGLKIAPISDAIHWLAAIAATVASAAATAPSVACSCCLLEASGECGPSLEQWLHRVLQSLCLGMLQSLWLALLLAACCVQAQVPS